MSETAPNRRAFLKTGALFAAPVAFPAAALAAAPATRVADQDDTAALHALHHAWLRDPAALALLAGEGETVRRIMAEPADIEIAPNGRHASARFACTIDLATDLPEGGTFAQMARLQGNGLDLRTEHVSLATDYVKLREEWEVARIRLFRAVGG